MTVVALERTSRDGVGVALRGDVRVVVETVTADGVVRPARDDAALEVRARVVRDGSAAAQGEGPAGRRATRQAPGPARVVVEVQHAGGAPVDRSVRVRAVMAGVASPWWLVPGVFYGANRRAECTRVYPRFVVGGGSAGPAALESDRWEFRADRAATPAVFAWGDRGGVAIVAVETSALGMTGVGFAHDADASVASVHVTFPFREGPVSYDGSEVAAPAEVATYRWHDGERVVLEAEVHLLGPDRHGYAPVLRAMHGRGAAGGARGGAAGGAGVSAAGGAADVASVGAGGAADVASVGAGGAADGVAGGAGAWVPPVDVATAADVAAHGLLRWHYDPDPGVLLETAAFDRELRGRDGLPPDRQAMHVGWVSGIPWAYALLAHGRRVGDDAAVKAAGRVIDTCCELAPSGTFWGVWYRDRGSDPGLDHEGDPDVDGGRDRRRDDGSPGGAGGAGRWTQSWSPVPRALHSRTLGEATLFLLRAVALEAAAGVDRARWAAAARSNLDAVVRRQRADGNLGSLHDAETGEVLSWAGSAGLGWVAALAESPDDGGRHLAAAERAGEYYATFVEAGALCGAPEDTDLAPTSEDGYVALMAYLALYRRTGAARWLDLARRSADWMLTFRYTYDVTFPASTPLGAWGFRTRGADQASPANQHLHAYGLVCTRELVELGEALGDPWYAGRALETLACFRQLVPTYDGEYGAYRGMVTERYYQTACFQPKGMVLGLSHAWSVGALLLACEDAVRLGLA